MLANLCVNARDAIADVGTVVIEVRNARLDDAFCRRHADAVAGDFVLLSVGDDGAGMSAETLEKVFEPFFTTKGLGKGTGLGLATVFGIVKQNGGFVLVHSQLGAGTTFEIYLPRHAGEPAPARTEEPLAVSTSGGETILLVEDEPGILSMVRLMLERLGYRVLAVSKPAEAIRVAEAHAGAIHLLVTDVIMPEMNGSALAGQVTAVCPRIRCLYMSGYADDAIARHGVLEEGIAFIQKPFSMRALAAKVREALARGTD